MKILMIAPQPFFEPRGTPISILQRLTALSMLGHQVDLATYSIGTDVVLSGVRICRAASVPFIQQVPIGPSWRKLVLDAVLFVRVFWMLLIKRYDVIHSHEEGAFLALVLAPLFRTPHLYDMHSSLPRQLSNFNFGNRRLMVKIFEAIEHRILNSARVVLTIGRDLEEYVLARNTAAVHMRIENVAVQQATPWPHGAAAGLRAQLGLGERLPIVYTGNFERYQGLDLLFQSMRLLIAKHPDVALVMVGGQSDQIEHWRAEVYRLGLSKQVAFAGTVTLEDSLAYLDLAEILVSPRTEGLSVPLKLYSYLQSGKPVVATRIEAHTQILSDDTAVLVEPGPEAFARGLARLVENPDLRQQVGRSAAAYAAQELSLESYLTKLKRVYQAIPA